MRKKRLAYLTVPLLGVLCGGVYIGVPCACAAAAGFGLRALAEWLRGRKSGPRWWAYAALAPTIVPLALMVREAVCQEWFWQLAALLLLALGAAYVFGWLAGGAFEKEDMSHET